MPHSDPSIDSSDSHTAGPIRQLIDLITETVASEQAIMTWDEEEKHSINQQHQSDMEASQNRYDHQIDELTQAHETALANVRQNFDDRLTQLTQANSQTLENLKQESDQNLKSAQDQLNQDLWLADSVVEGIPERLEHELNEVRKYVEQEAAHLSTQKSLIHQSLHQWKFHPATKPSDPIPTPQDPLAAYEEARDAAALHMKTTVSMRLPRFTFGAGIPLLMILLLISGTAMGVLLGGWPNFPAMGMGGGCGLVIGLGAMVAFRFLSRRAITHAYALFTQDQSKAEAFLKIVLQQAVHQHHQTIQEMDAKHNAEIASAHKRLGPLIESVQKKNAQTMDAFQSERDQAQQALLSERDQTLQEMTRSLDEARKLAESNRDAALKQAQVQQNTAMANHDVEAKNRWDTLTGHWQQGLQQIGRLDQIGSETLSEWEDERTWASWKPPVESSVSVRFGHIHVNLGELECGLPQSEPLRQTIPGPLSVPANISLAHQGSLLIQTGPEGRSGAIAALRSIMTRWLTQMPPGHARFTVIDPVDLGRNFAGFMHLADYDEALIGQRILTDAEAIEKNLVNLSSHLENIIQKCLRNEFDTIEAYNAQAGELAEPYRFLVISDFPTGFSEESIRRLNSIISSGPRCGVYTLMVQDTRQPPDRAFRPEAFKQNAVIVNHVQSQWQIDDPILGDFPLELDAAPGESLLSDLMKRIGVGAQKATRIEVPFQNIEPSPEKRWTASAAHEIQIPIGRIGATRQQLLSLGRGVAQHVLIGGKTGSGKTTLLHAIVTNMALWYRPNEVQVYMVDFKRGIEFKSYATAGLPHARAIAIESDREFGLSILQSLDAQMQQRGELFRTSGVQDLASYRQKFPDQALPRILLVIDEFQEFFSEEDKLAQDASLLLDRLVRQGRAFGIHLILGSQTLAGAYGLARSTLGQIAVRIALQCNESDSELILSDGNTAARLLSRPGEAIYNDASGMVESNSPFQTAWLDDSQRDDRLQAIADLNHQEGLAEAETIVFDGSTDANVAANRPLAQLLASPHWSTTPSPLAYLGEPIAIKSPTAAVQRRLNGRNMLIVGQRDQEATAMLSTAMVSLATQDRGGRFIILDGLPSDLPHAGLLGRTAAKIPHDTQVVPWRQSEEAIDALHVELNRRLGLDQTDLEPSRYLIICGLQRYRMLRRREDDYSFGGEDKPPTPDKQFAALLRDGPPLGIHTLLWCDTYNTLERTFERATLREFETRVLFQMSATDSSNLIDSPEASRLGLHRSLLHNEEDGVTERFRPYALPSEQWLDSVGDLLRQKTTVAD